MDALPREWLERLPKTDLHVHLDGSVRPETMIELAREFGRPLPAWEPDELADRMHVKDARNLPEYLKGFETTLSVMQTAEALERIAYELAEDAARENVRYLEVRYSPILHTEEGLPLEETVDAPLRGLYRAEREFGIRTGLIVCGLRHLEPDTTLRLAELAVAFKDRGVIAFDLAGPEHGYPAREHRAAFELVAAERMAITVHAGEAAGPESVQQALIDCHANRIGHGTRLFEDPELVGYCKDRRIPIEICLTSNVQTHAVEGFGTHPLRYYYDEGLVVTLNTDNHLMSATTVTEEYWRAHRHLGFGWDELCEIAIMGFESAFLPHEEKAALIEEVRGEIDRILA